VTNWVLHIIVIPNWFVRPEGRLDAAFTFEGWDPADLEIWLQEVAPPGAYWAAPCRLSTKGDDLVVSYDRALRLEVPEVEVSGTIYGWSWVDKTTIKATTSAAKALAAINSLLPLGMRAFGPLPVSYVWEARGGTSWIEAREVSAPGRI